MNRLASLCSLGVAALLSASAAQAVELEARWNGTAAHLFLPGAYPQYVVERAEGGGSEFTLVQFAETGCTEACIFDDYGIVAGRAYDYRIRIFFRDGSIATYGPERVEVDDLKTLRLDSRFSPNPVVDGSELRFRIPGPLAGGSEVSVLATLHDVSGRLVRTLSSKPLSAGEHSLVWDGFGERGSDLRSGAYFYRIQVGEKTELGRFILLR